MDASKLKFKVCGMGPKPFSSCLLWFSSLSMAISCRLQRSIPTRREISLFPAMC